MNAFRLSLGWLTVHGAHPLQHIDAAVAGRFDAVGLRLVPPAPTDPLIPVVGDERLIREVLVKLADTGISVLDVETVWIGPDLDVAGLRPALETAQRLGTSNLLTMGNDGDEARLTDTFARLCEEAPKFALHVGMEFAAYTKVPTIQAALRLVKALGQENGKVLIDALHLARSGGTPSDVAQLDPKWLAYCQLADARGPRPASDDALRAEARAGRYLPGEGDLTPRGTPGCLARGPAGRRRSAVPRACDPIRRRARAAGGHRHASTARSSYAARAAVFHPKGNAMNQDFFDRLAIRDLIENWALWRDAGDWERFATVWHDDGVMMATWFQGPAKDFIRLTKEGWAKGVSILHFLGGMTIDLVGERAIVQTKMTISQRGDVQGVPCDVVCTGRFYDFVEKRNGRWGVVLRQPIYEKDRIDPIDPAARLEIDQARLAAFPQGYRHLAYIQTQIGYKVKLDMPQLTGPEVEKLYARGKAWLAGGRLTD